MKNGLLAGVWLTSLLPAAAHATLLWDGDASKGTGVFGNLQPVNGTITIVDDPTYGKVFKIVCEDNGNTKARSEVSRMAGITLSNSGDYYVGWRSKWGPLPTKEGKWQVISQIHLDGPGSMGGPVPFGLSVPGDGKMHFNAQDPTGKSSSMWDHDLPLDSWHKYVVHTKMGETLETGFCEIWFDGVKQTLTNGKQSIPCAMAHASSGSYWKWGIYRSGSGGPIGQSVHYLQRPMMGTTYEDVAGGDGSGGGGGGGSGGSAGTPDAAAPVEADSGATGGASGTGGAMGTGGVTGTGGSTGSGGAVGTGGSMGTGGVKGTGGATMEPPVDPGDEPAPTKHAAGGGCDVAGRGGAGAWVLLALLLVWRRRAIS
jgi:Polysaccharide lyase